LLLKEVTRNYLGQCPNYSRWNRLHGANALLVKEFSALYGTRRFITVFTRARHWSIFLYGNIW
jgi:hypothetical protein